MDEVVTVAFGEWELWRNCRSRRGGEGAGIWTVLTLDSTLYAGRDETHKGMERVR